MTPKHWKLKEKNHIVTFSLLLHALIVTFSPLELIFNIRFKKEEMEVLSKLLKRRIDPHCDKFMTNDQSSNLSKVQDQVLIF